MFPSVVNAYVLGNKLALLHRDEQGELRQTTTRAEYSLFVHKRDSEKIEPLRRKRTVREEGDFLRLVCNSYEERDALCRGRDRHERGWFELHEVTTYEADLSPVRRWLIDSGIKIQKPLYGCLDLESDSRVPFSRLGQGRILCWGFVRRLADGTIDRVGGVLEADTDDAERELLLDLFHELASVDQILAWSGDRFDFVLLKERIERLGLSIMLRRWLLLDHMELFKKLNMTASESGDEKASAALARVADSLDVRGKLQEVGVGELAGVPVGGKHAWAFWAAGGENRRILGHYCVEDAATMLRIEGKTGFIDTLATLAETCGVFPDSRGMKGLNFVESFVMRIGASRGMRAPTKYGLDRSDEDREKFRGAFVFPTRRGLFDEVHICDFARLYPSIMQAWNMSPETYVGPALSSELDQWGNQIRLSFEDACAVRAPGVAVCPITREQFRVDGPRGLFAYALDVVVEQRKYWSKLAASLPIGSPERAEAERRDAAYKIIANTFYGVSGSPFSRYFMRELSESVTQIGVWLIQNTAAAADPTRDFRKDLRAAKTDPNLWHIKKPVPYKPFEGRAVGTVAGDTDSGFFRGCSELEFKDFVQWCNAELYPGIIAPSGANASLISVAFEKSFSLMINCEKKTYAGRSSHKKGIRSPDNAKPTIKGLEYKRGDTARLARDFQEEVVRRILFIGEPVPKPYTLKATDLLPLVQSWQKKILEREFEFSDAVIAKAMKKSIDEYGGTDKNGRPKTPPAHVQIAKLLEERGEAIYVGAKIEYVVVDGKASPMKCAPATDVKVEDLDVWYLWESLVWPAASRVLSACYPDHPWRQWGEVRPLSGRRGTLPGQTGFGFGERAALAPRTPSAAGGIDRAWLRR